MRAEKTQSLYMVPQAHFWVSVFLGILAALSLFPGCLGSGSVLSNSYIPGIYEVTGQGYRGPVHVQIQVAPAGIEDIIITGHADSIFPGAAAMEELLELVLEYGSLDLDAIAGATFSSMGFLEAVEDAVGQAYGQVKPVTSRATAL